MRRRRKGKRKYLLYYALFALLAVAVSAVLSLTAFFKIETVDIRGNTRYSDSELLDFAGIKTGDNLLRFSAKKIARSIEEQYPYVSSAQVRRHFPSGVTIDIITAEPFVTIETNDEMLLLDQRGRVLEKSEAFAAPGVMRVIGFTGEKTVIQKDAEDKPVKVRQKLSPGDFLDDTEEQKLSLLDQILQELAVNSLSVSVIDLTDPVSVKLLYDGRIVVLLASANDLAYKIKFAANAIFTTIEPHFIGVLDVSVRPTAKIRPQNIYDEKIWPFPHYMRGDYLQSGAPSVEIVEEQSAAPGQSEQNEQS